MRLASRHKHLKLVDRRPLADPDRAPTRFRENELGKRQAQRVTLAFNTEQRCAERAGAGVHLAGANCCSTAQRLTRDMLLKHLTRAGFPASADLGKSRGDLIGRFTPVVDPWSFSALD
jgi:hypothetical protein